MHLAFENASAAALRHQTAMSDRSGKKKGFVNGLIILLVLQAL
jgi:hypothetical protein